MVVYSVLAKDRGGIPIFTGLHAIESTGPANGRAARREAIGAAWEALTVQERRTVAKTEVGLLEETS